MKTYFHVDMDAFYASIEQRDNPDLRGRPVLVGGSADDRGVVAACSYEARAFGIHSAMPMARALRHCPDAVVVPVRMRHYQEVSSAVHAIFSHYSPDVMAISIDEAFLDMTGSERLLGDPEEVARRLKEHVRSLTELTISVGIGSSRFIAKLASEVDKPDGLHRVPPGDEADFVLGLELKDLWGLGTKTQRRLEALGIRSVGDLRARELPFLRGHFGERGGTFLFHIARGEDPGIYTGETTSHSVSAERTFSEDLSDGESIRLRMLALTEEIFGRAMREKWLGRTVTIKFRFHDFETHTYQRSLDHPVHDRSELFTTAWTLFRERWNGEAIRLLGAGISGSVEGEASGQMSLFEDEKNRRLDSALLDVQERFGRNAVTRASLMPPRKNEEKSDSL